MPFGGWGDDYYESIYKPAVESAGLEAHRADDLFRPSTIVHDIWAYTKKAKLLLADLTDRNPNVFYELGLAHALGKPAILVACSMEEVPFDLRALRVIIYDKNDPNWGQILKEKISNSIKEVLESPVAAVLPTFLEPDRGVTKPVVSERDLQQAELKQLRQEIEMIRQEMRMRPDGPRMRPPMTPGEAKMKVRSYLSSGMPESMIIDRLHERGVPVEWVIDRLQELKERRRAPKGDLKREENPGADE